MQEVTKAEWRRAEEEDWQPLEGATGFSFIDEEAPFTEEQFRQWREALSNLGGALRGLGFSIRDIGVTPEEFRRLAAQQRAPRQRHPLSKREKAAKRRKQMAKASRKANRR